MLDAILKRRPRCGRVACETACDDRPRSSSSARSRRRPTWISRPSCARPSATSATPASTTASTAETCGVMVSIKEQSARHRHGRRPGARGARRARARTDLDHRRRRPGHDDRLRLQRDAGVHAAHHRAGPPALPPARRRAQDGRPAATCGPTARARSPSSTSYGKPEAHRHRRHLHAARPRHRRDEASARRHRSSRSSSPSPRRDARRQGTQHLHQPHRPLRDRRAHGRRRPHRPQDHRRHLRRHRPPRRRRLLRQGPHQGRPLRRLRGPLRRQEHRRRRPRRPLRGPGLLRHRRGPPASRSAVETFGTGKIDDDAHPAT